MSATITIILTVDEDLLLVPNGAVKRQGATSFVNVIKDDGSVEQRTVTTGKSDSTNTSITTGLTEGETVQTGTVTTQASTTGAATPQGPRATPAGGVR
jgi:hypothetical protein